VAQESPASIRCRGRELAFDANGIGKPELPWPSGRMDPTVRGGRFEPLANRLLEFGGRPVTSEFLPRQSRPQFDTTSPWMARVLYIFYTYSRFGINRLGSCKKGWFTSGTLLAVLSLVALGDHYFTQRARGRGERHWQGPAIAA
jgi:hypothetical protein